MSYYLVCVSKKTFTVYSTPLNIAKHLYTFSLLKKNISVGKTTKKYFSSSKNTSRIHFQ